MNMIECVLLCTVGGLTLAFLIWFARVPKTLDGPSKVKPKPYFIIGGVLGVVAGFILYFGVFKGYQYLYKKNDGSSITAEEEERMNSAGYVRKDDGKWYYVGDSPNNDKNKVTITIENK